MDEFETRYRATLNRWFERIRADRWARRHTFTEPQFEKHVKAIGQLLLAWNDLHEKLGSLFVFSLGGGWVNRPLALWHSIRTDLSKRELLRAAIKELPPSELAGREKLKEEIFWILENAKSLEGVRDDAAHTPLYYYPPMTSPLPIQHGVFADSLLGNRRAERLNNDWNDLVVLFEYARQRIIILRDYALAIDLSWGNARLPWPDRPPLPNPPPKKQRQLPGRSRRHK